MSPGVGLLLCDDLIFTSRIVGTARALGLVLHSRKDVASLLSLANAEQPSCVIVDLQAPGLDLPALLTRLKEVCQGMPRVVGYGSHVEAATLRAARQAGCDPVLPRSAFVESLAEDLPIWLGDQGSST
jgi:DNA-binding NarL/FixJ family response regulator